MCPVRFSSAFLFAAAVLLTSSATWAQPTDDVWRVRFESGALHQWQTDLDDAGDVGVDAWSILTGADYALNDSLRLGLSAGYGERDYRFDGDAGFAALEPWNNVRDARVSASINWKADERWNLFAVPTLRWFAEEGASLDEGRFGGLLAAAAYKVNDRLSIGPGFGVFSELEDETDWFPILAIDWRLSETLALRTGRGFAATRGPGLSLDWTPSNRWSLTLGARYEKARFRLSDSGIGAGGIGQDTSVPVYLGATRQFGRHLSLSFVAGVEFAGELRLEDAAGNLIDKSNYDSAPFGGATLDLRF
jgi:outer membrane receptor protein involved in Fe transport